MQKAEAETESHESQGMHLRREAGVEGTSDHDEVAQITIQSGAKLPLIRETLGGGIMYSRTRAVAELSKGGDGLVLTVTPFGVVTGVCVNDTAVHGSVTLRVGDRVCFSRYQQLHVCLQYMHPYTHICMPVGRDWPRPRRTSSRGPKFAVDIHVAN